MNAYAVSRNATRLEPHLVTNKEYDYEHMRINFESKGMCTITNMKYVM